jgi:hypothetical protein
MFGVATEIHEHLIELRRIGQHGARRGAEMLADVNRAGQQGTYEPESVLDDVVELDGLALLVTLTAEHKDLLDQVLGTVSSREYSLHRLADRAVRRDLLQRQFGIA